MFSSPVVGEGWRRRAGCSPERSRTSVPLYAAFWTGAPRSGGLSLSFLLPRVRVVLGLGPFPVQLKILLWEQGLRYLCGVAGSLEESQAAREQ